MSLHRRQRSALLAIKLTRSGLRRGAYPTTMPALEAAGLVAERPRYRGQPAEMCWFLTAAGRKALRVAGSGEVRTPDRD